MTCVICKQVLDDNMIKKRKKTCAEEDCQVSHESSTSKLRKKKARQTKKDSNHQSNPSFDSKSVMNSLIYVLQDARASKDTSFFIKAFKLLTNTNFDELLITIRQQANFQVAVKVVDISHYENMKDMVLFAADNLLLTALDLNEFYLGITCLPEGIVYGFFLFQTLRLAMMQLKEIREKLAPEQATSANPPTSPANAIQWFSK